MAYRNEPKPKCERRVIADATTRSFIYVDNGCTASIAIPCWYENISHPKRVMPHDRAQHDFVGQPTPESPDSVCQAKTYWGRADDVFGDVDAPRTPVRCMIDMDCMVPIHLLDEGYTSVNIAFEDAPIGLSATGSIDKNEDWVVRVDIDAQCQQATKDNLSIPFTIFVSTTIGKPMREVVAKGTLVILAGPIL